jgi:hypothetical protein
MMIDDYDDDDDDDDDDNGFRFSSSSLSFVDLGWSGGRKISRFFVRAYDERRANEGWSSNIYTYMPSGTHLLDETHLLW